jgi:glycosyltransferase involved in cell wall biosynthesis
MNATRRIRVLYVVGNFVAGGAERHLLELWSRIDRDRFEIEIACFQKSGQFLPEVQALRWPIRDLGVGVRLYDTSGVRGFLRLLGLVRRFRPDVIHGYLFGPNLFAALAGRWMGVRAAVIAKRSVDAFETPRQIRIQRFSHRLATHVIAVSEAVGETAIALGAPRARVTVIPNGVDVRRFDSIDVDRDALGLNGSRPVIGSVGCLAPRKDYGTLLDALATLARRGRDFHAVLVGDGPERSALEEHARRVGVQDRVRFLGERPDVERLLMAMDVFVLSSREEGIPNALLEAMAAGRAAVASEILTDGKTGWLIPARSPEILADTLERVLADPAEAARRGQAARREALEHFDIGTMVRRHEEFYRRVSGS